MQKEKAPVKTTSAKKQTQVAIESSAAADNLPEVTTEASELTDDVSEEPTSTTANTVNFTTQYKIMWSVIAYLLIIKHAPDCTFYDEINQVLVFSTTIYKSKMNLHRVFWPRE